MTVYKTPNCPMCAMLINKLKEKNITFDTIEDKEILREKNITFVPVLEVENKQMSLKEALKWIGDNYD